MLSLNDVGLELGLGFNVWVTFQEILYPKP